VDLFKFPAIIVMYLSLSGWRC